MDALDKIPGKDKCNCNKCVRDKMSPRDRLCPTCGREMRAVTARTKDEAWKCDYCAHCEVGFEAKSPPTFCKDCGTETKPGWFSARCEECWEDRCGASRKSPQCSCKGMVEPSPAEVMAAALRYLREREVLRAVDPVVIVLESFKAGAAFALERRSESPPTRPDDKEKGGTP